MTPTQADREAAAEIWQSVKRAFLKYAGPEYDDIGNTLALPYATRHRLAAEAAAFEKAAGVFSECVVQQARDAGVRPVSPQSPGEWRDTVRRAAIRKLAGEKHD